MRALAFIAVMISAPGPVFAQDLMSSLADPRIQYVQYDPDQIVMIRGALGFQLMLEFAPDERIENVSIGDSLGWQVTPNRRANVLFLKPVDGSSTNMTVLTNVRRYAFDLTILPKGSRQVSPYAVRFSYPQVAVALPVADEPETERPPQVANDAYRVTGSREVTPLRVFDDGLMTYFEWPTQGPVPAIFAVGADGSESVVNYGVRGPYIVVEQLSGKFSLRNGAQVATVVNGQYGPGDGRASK